MSIDGPSKARALRATAQRSRLLAPVRTAKHWMHLAAKRGRSVASNIGNAAYSRFRPFEFEPDRYSASFVSRAAVDPGDTRTDTHVPRRIFVIWSGDNPMSPARRSGLDSIRRINADCDVVLVSPSSLTDVVVPDHPLHATYSHLSLVHRADYLRAYLMHHHGGGYSDVKPHLAPWASAFDALDADRDAWIIGYRLPGVDDAAVVDGPIGRDIRRHYRRLIGSGGYIARARTPLTREWLAEIELRLDHYQGALASAPGNTWGDNEGYPVPWTALGSQVLEPLCLKYLPHVRQAPEIRPQLFDHR